MTKELAITFLCQYRRRTKWKHGWKHISSLRHSHDVKEDAYAGYIVGELIARMRNPESDPRVREGLTVYFDAYNVITDWYNHFNSVLELSDLKASITHEFCRYAQDVLLDILEYLQTCERRYQDVYQPKSALRQGCEGD